MKLSDKTFDTLSWVGKIVLPALSVLYATLGGIWNLPYTDEVPLTIMAVDVFLNALLGITSVNYYKEQAEAFDTGKGEE